MSKASERGRNFELKIAKILRSKLGVKVTRDKQSGAGTNKSDISDYARQIPLHMELKDQAMLKLKEWFRQADAGASVGQAATVVFAMDEEIMAVLRLSDLLDFLREIKDQQRSIEHLHAPIEDKHPSNKIEEAEADAQRLAEQKAAGGARTCRNGHLSDEYGYCNQKDCKFSRGYRPKKGANK